jgi:hypothetical protein
MAKSGAKRDREGVYFEKDASDVVPYTFDWADPSNLFLDNDTISTSAWAVQAIAGDTSALAVDSSSKTDRYATVLLSAGSNTNIYRVTNTITTANGNTFERFMRILVKDRTV